MLSVVDAPGATSKFADFEVAPVAVTRMHCTSLGACVTAICAVPTFSEGSLPPGVPPHPMNAPTDTAPIATKERKFMDILPVERDGPSYQVADVVKRGLM
jgi:hypothetical protein